MVCPSLLEELAKEETWLRFREYKSLHSHMSQKEFDWLDAFIAEKRYLPIAGTMEFSIPEKKRINKSGSGKKRVVYLFPPDETMVLKLLTWLLYKYDHAFEPGCYSFRQRYTAKTAFTDILSVPDLDSKYVLKADIHDYFNSMPVDRLQAELASVINDDPPLLEFLCGLFGKNKAVDEGKTVEGPRGAMAGMPVSAFCANIYLADLDRFFADKGIPCYRYSDDILILADSKEELDKSYKDLEHIIGEKGLTLNPKKLTVTGPGEPWDFLGFKYSGGRVDLSDATVMKMKSRIKRKAHALYRWRIRKDAEYDRTAAAMIRKFNRKFYDLDEERDFTWSRWFFPVLTSTEGLKVLDDYLVMYLRYLYSGRHYKGNYAVTYDRLKSLGFRSLVNEYYRFRNEEK